MTGLQNACGWIAGNAGDGIRLDGKGHGSGRVVADGHVVREDVLVRSIEHHSLHWLRDEIVVSGRLRAVLVEFSVGFGGQLEVGNVVGHFIDLRAALTGSTTYGRV